jgi:preprotein translocase subunit SecD
MNRYSLWKYIVIVVALLIGALYTLPNFYGEAPAVQVSSIKATIKVDAGLLQRVADTLKKANVQNQGLYLESTSTTTNIKARFRDEDTQIKAKDILSKELNPDEKNPSYAVALNLVSNSPSWLTTINALPMYLGLDLRGGIYVLLQVDMKAALTKRLDNLTADVRTMLRDKNIRHSGITREGSLIRVKFRDADTRQKAKDILQNNLSELALTDQDGAELSLVANIKPQAEKSIQENALKQNISTLHNRVNELGVAEPVVQQQGADRIVVQFPGVQDSVRVREILGRTASLEVRLVDETADLSAAMSGRIPFDDDLLTERGGGPILIKKQVVLTGDRFTDAQPSFDSRSNQPVVTFSLDALGARIFRDVTRENVKRRMAILLVEKGKSEVITAPTIESEIGGGRVQITGHMTTAETTDMALLIRSGSLAAPMEIIEERTIGPSLGADNIKKGFDSTLYGFTAIAIFMVIYYMVFGFFSILALMANLLFLVAILSMLQATLTLPGMAGIALTLGMAIDANVLINERIREELRAGNSPQAAIHAGYERAFATILDSNITTFIAGLFLFLLGSGPVRGFAVVLCLGILTSIFSAVVVSRSIVNLVYGSKKKLTKLSI